MNQDRESVDESAVTHSGMGEGMNQVFPMDMDQVFECEFGVRGPETPDDIFKYLEVFENESGEGVAFQYMRGLHFKTQIPIYFPTR